MNGLSEIDGRFIFALRGGHGDGGCALYLLEEIASSSQSLAHLAMELREAVSKFHV